ncbi:MAG: Cu(I)-responsive transcriptional regulator [Alphaproteobacteria bacterium]|nr:Cu(I)-responsive transcriptional regulator [Alphaproteobacteria bacterium]
MTVGDAGSRAGLPAKTLRYYEQIGLVVPARRPNGYRAYRGIDVHKLVFLKRARSLGFSIEDCRRLLSLWEDPARSSAEVRAIAAEHLSAIDNKIAELRSLRDQLDHLVEACHGDHRPECPILDDLAGLDALAGGRQ